MKQSEVARVLYDLKSHCRKIDARCSKCDKTHYDFCHKFVVSWEKPLAAGCMSIEQEDIERLRNKEIEPWTCKDCRQYPCAYPMDKICEGFELW